MTLKLANNRLPILTIFLADVNFQFFVSGGSASSEMTGMSVPKDNWGQPSKRDRKAPENPFSVSKWTYMIRKRAFFLKLARHCSTARIGSLSKLVGLAVGFLSGSLNRFSACPPISPVIHLVLVGHFSSSCRPPLQAPGPPPPLGSPGLGRGGCSKTCENPGIEIGLPPPPPPAP